MHNMFLTSPTSMRHGFKNRTPNIPTIHKCLLLFYIYFFDHGKNINPATNNIEIIWIAISSSRQARTKDFYTQLPSTGACMAAHFEHDNRPHLGLAFPQAGVANDKSF